MPEFARNRVTVEHMSSRLRLTSDGWWEAPELGGVSYPEEGSQDCYQLEDGSFWFQHRNKCLLAALEKYPPPGTFVDCGGGNGFVASALQEHGWDIVLLDPSAQGVRNARTRGLRHIIHSTVQGAGFEPGRLPAVGLFDVIEHVEDDRQMLAEINAALVPGGRTYVTVPAHAWLWSSDDVHAGHYRRYTAASLSSVLRAAGFEVEYVTHFFGLLPLPILGLRALPSWLGLHQGGGGRRAHREHRSRLTGLMLKLLDLEVASIRLGKSSRWGSSCLAVASKSQTA